MTAAKKVLIGTLVENGRLCPVSGSAQHQQLGSDRTRVHNL